MPLLKVKRAKYYAVIMDCTPDISHNEQLSVVLRIVNYELHKGVSIHKHFVGFLLAEDTTGIGLLKLFLGHLETLLLDISDCRGHSYDNSSNMQGKKQGVQKRVLDLNPKALCVPCGSHTLNMVIWDAAKSSTIYLNFYGVLQRLYNLFSGSVQRWAILQVNVNDFTIKALSTTRWECRVEAVKAVLYQLPDMLNALEALHDFAIEKSDSECASSASSLCRELKKWTFMVSCVVWYDVLYIINKVSKILQGPKVSIETMKREISAVIDFLQDFREHGFNATKIDAREIAEKIEVEMIWPDVWQKKTKTKRQFDYEGTEEITSTAEEHFRREFFLHLVDTALVKTRERF